VVVGQAVDEDYVDDEQGVGDEQARRRIVYLMDGGKLKPLDEGIQDCKRPFAKRVST
jgi:hypothetical protein